jgi:hypothetical protein
MDKANLRLSGKVSVPPRARAFASPFSGIAKTSRTFPR